MLLVTTWMSYNDARTESPPYWRFVCAYVIHCMRVNLIITFLYASTFLMGTADGCFNVLLNSLAVTFILEVDETSSAVVRVTVTSSL